MIKWVLLLRKKRLTCAICTAGLRSSDDWRTPYYRLHRMKSLKLQRMRTVVMAVTGLSPTA
jgi:hypothetical protein